MPNRLRAVNVVDFTGGLNLHVDSVQLLDNEVPELLNMEPDPRGGVRTRRGWDTWNSVPIADTWNPRSAYLHVNSDGTYDVLLANNNKLWRGTNGTFTVVPTIVCDAVPHLADFVSWGDEVRIACGRNRQAASFAGITNAVTMLSASGAGSWQDNYTTPGTGTFQPQSEIIATHQGYLFAAYTKEDGVFRPNRVRWSHPNNPNAWAQKDYIDIIEGGELITALVPFMDRLLIFKPDSVWALYGYDSETWQLTNVSRNLGCTHNQAWARSENACFFMSWPQGIFAYGDTSLSEISGQLRPVFVDNEITRAAVSNVWLGWIRRRLWVSVPRLEDNKPTATDATSAFVFDTEVGEGAWMQFKGSPRPPGPYMERPITDADIPLLAFSRNAPHALILDSREDPNDNVGTTLTPYVTRITTGWIDAGAPTHRKSWRRADFIVNGLQQPTEIQVSVFHNYDGLNPQRQFTIAFDPAPKDALWNQFSWNDGTKYMRGPSPTAIERGSTMGRAGTVRLRARGQDGMRWGFQGVIVKFIPRRFR